MSDEKQPLLIQTAVDPQVIKDVIDFQSLQPDLQQLALSYLLETIDDVEQAEKLFGKAKIRKFKKAVKPIMALLENSIIKQYYNPALNQRNSKSMTAEVIESILEDELFAKDKNKKLIAKQPDLLFQLLIDGDYLFFGFGMRAEKFSSYEQYPDFTKVFSKFEKLNSELDDTFVGNTDRDLPFIDHHDLKKKLFPEMITLHINNWIKNALGNAYGHKNNHNTTSIFSNIFKQVYNK